MQTLSERQEAILKFIGEFLEEKKAPPTVREIQERFGFKSTNAVAEHLASLEAKGCLKRRAGLSRGIEMKGKAVCFHPQVRTVPLVGQIAAGGPVLAEENIEGYLHLDKTLIRGEGYFLLKVQGDSMIEAGIHEGDLVLVQKRETAESGAMVVASLEGETTVKYLKKNKDKISLHPANSAYGPIRIDKKKHPDFRILGEVKAMLRVF